MQTEERNTCAQLPRGEAIAQLNDALRTQGKHGVIMVTAGVRDLRGFNPVMLAASLASYAAFDADNDPHGERDFGDMALFGADLLWKIDYYDQDLTFGSPDPADPAVTKRVLTVMLASEY